MSLENKITDYEKHKADIQHWFLLKGEYRYFKIIEFLEKEQIECSWENVTNYVKYDKRLLINSFKYLVFIEELFKSFINKFLDKPFEEVVEFGFRQSVDQFLSIGEKANYDDIDLKVLKKEKEVIIDFRNSVTHNKILLGRMFGEKDNKNTNLEDTIKSFIKILPLSYREGFIKDINSCSRGLNLSWNAKV